MIFQPSLSEACVLVIESDAGTPCPQRSDRES